MNRRQALTGAAIAAAVAASPAIASKAECTQFTEDQLQAAGTLWHFCQGDLHLALAALLKVSDAGCSL